MKRTKELCDRVSWLMNKVVWNCSVMIRLVWSRRWRKSDRSIRRNKLFRVDKIR